MEQFLDVLADFGVEVLWKLVVEIVIPLAVFPLIGGIVGWAFRTWAEFKRTKPDISWIMEQAAVIAVRAAEQLGLTNEIDNKLDYAISVAEKYLSSKGFEEFDLDLLRAMIEAEVQEQYNKHKGS